MTVVKKNNHQTSINPIKKLNVLLIEEHSMVAKLEKSYLSKGGFEVKVATTLQEMFDALSLFNIQVVILDYHAFKEQGIHEISNAKKLSFNKNVKFIVTSVVKFEELNNKSFQENCDNFILKPITKGRMIEEVKKISNMSYRKSLRIKSKLNILVRFNDRYLKTYSIDISEDGVHLADKKNIITPHIGYDLDLEIILPNSSKPIFTKGNIMSSNYSINKSSPTYILYF